MAEIQTTHPKDGLFKIFAVFFAFYLMAHHVYVYGGLGIAQAGPTIVILPAAFLLMLWPGNLPLFVFAVAIHFFQTLMILPTGSNHTIMSLFMTAGLIAAYLHVAISQRQIAVSPEQYYDTFAPIGRWLLIIMYFYGSLHKVNTDFLNPVSSCSVAMWRRYGFPELIAESTLIHTMTMYGTLVVEAVAIVLLLTRRFRWWGIILGVSFHGFLGAVPPGRIVAFSLLSILLHSLFLPKTTLDRFADGAFGRFFLALFAPPLRRIALGLAGVLICLMMPRELAWGVLMIMIVGFVVVYGRESAQATAAGPRFLVSRSAMVNLLVVAFFLNGAAPYLGFKTGQTLAMFSNLITEGGRSNHLIVPNIRLFDHQYRIATMLETDHPVLAQWQRDGYKMVEFQVLDYLSRSPERRAKFVVNGQTYAHSPDKPLNSIARLPPRWLRNLIVFRPVVLESPRNCDSY